MANAEKVICCFERIIGLKVSPYKSSLMGINVPQEEVTRFAEIMECQIQNWPINYFGLPLGCNPISLAFWEPVLLCFQKKRAVWKREYLSLGREDHFD